MWTTQHFRIARIKLHTKLKKIEENWWKYKKILKIVLLSNAQSTHVHYSIPTAMMNRHSRRVFGGCAIFANPFKLRIGHWNQSSAIGLRLKWVHHLWYSLTQAQQSSHWSIRNESHRVKASQNLLIKWKFPNGYGSDERSSKTKKLVKAKME